MSPSQMLFYPYVTITTCSFLSMDFRCQISSILIIRSAIIPLASSTASRSFTVESPSLSANCAHLFARGLKSEVEIKTVFL
jgi:hypothetical protein